MLSPGSEFAQSTCVCQHHSQHFLIRDFVRLHIILFFILSNVCFCFRVAPRDQCQSSGPFLTDGSHSCEKGEVWGATLSPELRTRLGAATRRGSAPVIDTGRASQIAQLHALIQSHRSISPTPTQPDYQLEVHPPQLHSEAECGFPFRCSVPEYRRFSDTPIRPPSEATGENSTLPVQSERRHSDLSSFLSLTSHHNHAFATLRGHVCQVCLSLLLLRSSEGSHRRPPVAMPMHHFPCDLRLKPSSVGAAAAPGYGHLKGSSDCSNFSLLQQSLFNIIGRKAAPCPAQAAPLASPAAPRPAHGDGDNGPNSRPPCDGLVGDQEPVLECEDGAREQSVTRAVGVVGHISRQVAWSPIRGPTKLSQAVGDEHYSAWSLTSSTELTVFL